MSLMSISAAARIAGVDRHTLRRYIDRGVLPATRTGINRYRVSTKNLEAFMASPGQIPVSAPLAPDPCEPCDICGCSGSVVDHCHACGFTRGWLCGSCNALEGMRQSGERIAGGAGEWKDATWGDWRQRCALSAAQFYGNVWVTPNATGGRLGLTGPA